MYPYEPLKVDLSTLGLNLNEKATIMEIDREATIEKQDIVHKKRDVTLKEITIDVINRINESIQKKGENNSVKEKRYFVLNTTREPLLSYNRLGLSPDNFYIDDESEKKIWLWRIINALVEKGHLFELNTINGHGYFIQA